MPTLPPTIHSAIPNSTEGISRQFAPMPIHSQDSIDSSSASWPRIHTSDASNTSFDGMSIDTSSPVLSRDDSSQSSFLPDPSFQLPFSLILSNQPLFDGSQSPLAYNEQMDTMSRFSNSLRPSSQQSESLQSPPPRYSRSSQFSRNAHSGGTGFDGRQPNSSYRVASHPHIDRNLSANQQADYLYPPAFDFNFGANSQPFTGGPDISWGNRLTSGNNLHQTISHSSYLNSDRDKSGGAGNGLNGGRDPHASNEQHAGS
ncbi:hypothetical protein GGR57DRAFT_468545 [Xylariaceae sp. FL1272]|nr:hypothetical protein GGR57DRAFT_468545 [Xylariaceae sp. FL1272]